MSKFIGTVHHPSTSLPIKIYEGFSWPCFFLGIFWYMAKNVWKWAVISFLAALITFGFSWVVFPFLNNKQYIRYLLEKGYLPDENARKYLLAKGLITEDYPILERKSVTA